MAAITDENQLSRTDRKNQSQLAPAIISTLEIYGLEEAKRRLGWTNAAYRAAKRRGLRVMACGKRRYLSSREVLRFLEAINDVPSEHRQVIPKSGITSESDLAEASEMDFK